MDVLSTRPLPDGLVGVIVMFDVQRRASMGEIAFDCEDGRYRYLGLSYGPLGEDAASETRGYSDSLLADDLRKVTLFPWTICCRRIPCTASTTTSASGGRLALRLPSAR